MHIKTSTQPLKCSLSTWLTERYSLFTVSGEKVFRGDVLHDPWNLNECKVLNLDDHFSDEFGFSSNGRNLNVAYSSGIDVRFVPFKRIE